MGAHHITAGFLPLLDSAVLVTAREKGFAAEEGIELTLSREISWANIRDRIAVGHFDVAHMLAPMPIATNLGLTPMRLDMVAPFALGLGGNAVSVSKALWSAMADAGAGGPDAPAAVGAALRRVVEERRSGGRERLRFAVVHPYSGHNFELRYWLAACGIDPERDVEITIVPPPLTADAVAAGRIDGFCVGEPWSSVAVAGGHAHIATVKAAIWKSSPEKVIGVRADWAEAHRETLHQFLRALYRAALWCGESENREELAAMLAGDTYLAQPKRLLLGALEGRLQTGGGVQNMPEFFLPVQKAANFPWQSHALWFYSQMVRWGQVAHGAANAETARRTFRPDIYRAALGPLGAPMPSASMKVEGALDLPTPVGSASGRLILGPDGFFDGAVFDPEKLDNYIAGQRVPATNA
ncbi:CmpA/NrtA family ABC transporter substrate-binding protein [Chelativorans sp. M5D2P16]|uniref:CmpA/NrtA family ABC transporter substrate-binding protein n=1 Tax=Chelativorans sp. M5D2P16 TaxID=3095678 RepID=UPI002ACAA6FF|nr:CmpA/NrtA family ABC transporter substrate-binding protein [Chelativorans sp. M5D2P16]MDZ5698294.1 CmpA/NrtA family ABC transporter substrate-binding protein [Chelativorans sp. M5D2P16]